MNAKTKTQGRLYYDATCVLCRTGVARLRPFLEPRGVAFVPFEDGAAEPEMKLRWHDGREFGGGDAGLFLAGLVWWTRPIHWLGRLPGVAPLVRFLYRQVAARRHCFNGTCRVD